MVIERAEYEIELTSVPEGIDRAIELSNQNLSRCRCIYNEIRPNIRNFEKMPKIESEIVFD